MADRDAVAEARHRNYYNGLDRLKAEQNLTTHGANDVLYLRTQPNYTPEKEQKLIEAYQAGLKPNVMDYT